MSGKAKSRRVLRVKEAIGVKSAKSRSGDLIALTEQFNCLKASLKHLVAALLAEHASMNEFTKARIQVAKHVASIAEKSPISDLAGQMTTVDGQSDSGVSYASIHASMLSRHKMYSDRFLKYVVNYAVEWEKVVVTRVSASLKKAELLRRDLDHYQGKVEALRQTVNVKMAKGKLVDPKESEKLKRNEDKLMTARKEYEEFVSDLCALIEEVTDRAWKDLHPLLIKLTQFDATRSSEEAKLFGSLNQVTESLKQIAQKHGLKPQARLKDIESQSAQMVCTKDSERALEYERSSSITAGDSSDGGLLSPSGGDSVASGSGMPLSPQSWAVEGGDNAPQSAPVARASSFSSLGSSSSRQMTTTDMLSLAAAAAPPPTMEMVNDATGAMTLSSGKRSSFSRHAQSTGSLPPLPPSSSHNISRSGSFQPDLQLESNIGRSASDGSLSFSGPVAPAPSAPPPPPPPAPALSMYSAPADTDVPETSMSLTPTHAASYSNYQAHAPAPVQTGLSSHPWSSNTQQTSANPFDKSPGGSSPYGSGALPVGQFGAASPPNSFGSGAPSSSFGTGAPAGGTSSTNPFDE